MTVITDKKAFEKAIPILAVPPLLPLMSALSQSEPGGAMAVSVAPAATQVASKLHQG